MADEMSTLRAEMTELRRRQIEDRAALKAVTEIVALSFARGGMPDSEFVYLLDLFSGMPAEQTSPDVFAEQSARREDLIVAIKHFRLLVAHHRGDRPMRPMS